MKKEMQKSLVLMAFSFLFIFICLAFANAIDITQIGSSSVINTHSIGTAGISFDNTGLKFFAADDLNGNQPNIISEYGLSTAYNISTLYFSSDTNLTPLLPANDTNYTISTSYFTRDGNNFYVVIPNATSGSKIGFDIVHYTLNNFDLSTLAFADKNNITLINGAYSPYVTGIYVTDDGSKLLLSGARVVGAPSRPYMWYYDISNFRLNSTFTSHFDSSSQTLNNTLFFPFVNNAYISVTSWNDVWVSPDNQISVFYESGTLLGSNGLLSNGQTQTMSFGLGGNGITLVNLYTGLYFYTEVGSVMKQYIVNNITISSSPAVNVSAGQEVVKGVNDAILGLYPDAATLSFKQKMGYTLFTMLLSVIIILFAASRLTSDGLHSAVMYIIIAVVVMEFFFFVAIEYISVGILVLIAIIGLGLAYLRLKGGNNGGK